MFWFREAVDGRAGRVDVVFTDASLDLHPAHAGHGAQRERLAGACGIPLVSMRQEHGDRVVVVDQDADGGVDGERAACDALVSTTRQRGLVVLTADCVPVVLADPDAGVVGAVHAGRQGVALGVVARAVDRCTALGARRVHAWVGPHVCGGCYEVPESMRDDLAARVPATRAETTWGTPSLDLGAGVCAQLRAAGVGAADLMEVPGCTREEPSLHSYRRDGEGAGRLAGVVWRT